MDYSEKLKKNSTIVSIIALILGAIFFILKDLLEGKITVLTIAYSVLILLAIFYLIKEIRKK